MARSLHAEPQSLKQNPFNFKTFYSNDSILCRSYKSADLLIFFLLLLLILLFH